MIVIRTFEFLEVTYSRFIIFASFFCSVFSGHYNYCKVLAANTWFLSRRRLFWRLR